MLLRKGSRGPDVKQLQQGLAAFGFHPGGVDGIFGGGTEDAVEDFQQHVKIYPDGLFGDGSARAWNQLCDAKNLPNYKFGDPVIAADPEDSTDKLPWVKCPAHKFLNGYSSTTLRSDAAAAYKKLYALVDARGGLITSAGGKRSLAGKASPSRSKKSFHYTGRAFDLAIYTAMQDADKDAYIVVRDEDTRYFTVWCKVMDATALLAGSVPTVTLEACTVQQGKMANGKRYSQLHYTPWTGKAFNLTEMAAALGFQRIRGRRSFFSGGSYTGAEWWHMQWQDGMVKGTTTFGQELLKAYALADARKFAYWDEAKDAVFGVSWG